MFDGIYTGTETRDPVITDQHLQQYESYEIIRYFENIAPGRNGGGWVDTFSIRYIDRYAEQLWDTLFAKARQMMLFEWSAMSRPIRPGDREAWQDLPTSFDYSRMLADLAANHPARLTEPTIARVAGYSLEQVDTFLGKLGNPIGIASYKPYQSTGEDFLHNYLGHDRHSDRAVPVFPTNADLVLLTESAKVDPDIVAKIKGQLAAGKSVVITSGLLHALQDRGIEDIVELRYTDRKMLAHEYYGGFGAGNGAGLGDGPECGILFPEIDFLTNDAWPLVRAMANGNGYPLLLMDRYSKGVLYVLTIPDNFADFYRLPPAVTSAIKKLSDARVSRPAGRPRPGRPVRLRQPHLYCGILPAHGNRRESFRGRRFTKLRNLVTGEEIAGQAPEPSMYFGGRRPAPVENRESFNVHLLPHSYAVFAAEK